MFDPPPMYLDYPPPPQIPQLPGVHVELANIGLWRKFHESDTEMVITKLGRRMFPHLKVRISGLNPDELYYIYLELEINSAHRYRFSGSKWTTAGRAEPQPPYSARTYMHPDSPAKGSHWMQKIVSFQRAKLTNSGMGDTPHIILSSMHKYIPRVVVAKVDRSHGLSWARSSFTFPETSFIAVTAYQNSEITKLKIDNNPFAKGFRENGLGRSKRKSQTPNESEEKRQNTEPCLNSLLSDSDSCDSPKPSSFIYNYPTSQSVAPCKSIPFPSYLPSQSMSLQWWNGAYPQEYALPHQTWMSNFYLGPPPPLPALIPPPIQPLSYYSNSLSPSSMSSISPSPEKQTVVHQIHRPWLDSAPKININKTAPKPTSTTAMDLTIKQNQYTSTS